MAHDPEEILLTYKPREGEFLYGVPQRDLSRADVANLMPFDRVGAEASGLYAPTEAMASFRREVVQAAAATDKVAQAAAADAEKAAADDARRQKREADAAAAADKETPR